MSKVQSEETQDNTREPAQTAKYTQSGKTSSSSYESSILSASNGPKHTDVKHRRY